MNESKQIASRFEITPTPDGQSIMFQHITPITTYVFYIPRIAKAQFIALINKADADAPLVVIPK